MKFINKICAAATAAAVSFCGIPMICSGNAVELSSYAESGVDDLVDAGTGIRYIISDGAAIVTGCDENAVSLNIPAQLGGVPVKAIGERAFESHNKLQTVTIAEGVVSIEKEAFLHCRQLVSAQLPSTVTNIGISAFDTCDSLTEVNIPDGITVINERAFYNCELEYVELPEGAKEIRERAFESNSNLLEVYIPDSVEVIGKNAFSGCQMLQYIVLPGVVRIEEYAFEGCTNMKKVILNNTLTYIGNDAFSYDRALKEIELPDSLITIGDHAFNDTGITNLTIPDNVQYIGAFAIPSDAVTETVDGVKYIGKWAVGCDSSWGNNFKVREGTVGIAEFTFASLYSGETSVELPSTIKYICQPVFYGSKMAEITISKDNPDICAVDNIIFSKDMTRLILYPQSKTDESYVIPDSVVEIGENAFADNKSLKNITFPDSVKYIDAHAFENCSGLTDLKLPNNLIEIGEYAFAGLKGLDYSYSSYSIDIPDSVTKIGRDAFSGSNCYKNYDNNINMVDDWIIFFGGSYNTTIEITKETRGIADMAFNHGEFQEIILPNTVEYIGDSAFSDCYQLEKIQLPEQLISIGDNAFANCNDLTAPVIPDSVVHIGAAAFDNCFAAMEDVEGVKYVDSWAVDADTAIKSANLRGGTRGISELAFYECTEMTSANLPDSVNFINDEAFEMCLSLTELKLSENLACIDMGAFAYCIALKEAEIPESTVYMDYAAFAGCEALEKITVNSPDCLIYDDEDTISSSAVIYGYTNSSAETYAKIFDRKFVPIGEITRVRGDVNADGTFGIADLVMMEEWLLGAGEMDDWIAGDLCEDNVIDVYDLCVMRSELLK